jgi:DUF1365 family protein
MSRFNSALYRGKVSHSRLAPFSHNFEYRVFYGLFDIDELGRLDKELRLFSLDRFNLFSFQTDKHRPVDGGSLRPWVDSLLAESGIDLEGGSVRLLAFPRVLGHVFDPISVWYCYGPANDLRAVIHEVRNTFGDKHMYIVPIAASSDMRHQFDKHLHVSPFNPMNQRYEFTVNEPAERIAIGISQSDADGLMFRAGLRLTRLPLTDRNLLRLFFTHPLVTLKAVGAIHWQALLLWMKGARFHNRPQPRTPNVTAVPRESIAS